MKVFGKTPEGFIKYCIWSNCERDLQEGLIFKIKVHTYKDIALQSLLLPQFPVEHEDFALPLRGTRGQSSTANTLKHLCASSSASVCQTCSLHRYHEDRGLNDVS